MARNHKFYRKIYETHNGKIPIDQNGRSYDVHHIDGDHTNNCPTNLIAIPIDKHYQIHKDLGDWGSCWAISLRMKLSPEEISDISKKSNEQRIKNGTHNFQNGEIAREYQLKKVKNNTHHFIDSNKGKEHPQYDHTIRTWKNKITGQVVSMTNYDLRHKFKLKSGAVSRVVNGKGLKSTGGWELFNDSSDAVNT